MKLNSFFLAPLMAISLVFTEPCDAQRKQDNLPIAPVTETPIDVVITYPRFEEITRSVSAMGKFGTPNRLVVRAEYRGFIEKIFVNEGDSVNEGDPLYNYRSEDLLAEIAKKQAEIREAEASLEYDQNALTLHRANPPKDDSKDIPTFPDEPTPDKAIPPKIQEGASPTPIAESKNALDNLASKIKLDEARIELLQKELEQLNTRKGKLNGVASLRGLIQKKLITEGAVIEAGDPLFEIVALNPISFSVNIPQDLASFVDRQTLIKIVLSGPQPITTEGSVYFVSPSIDPITKSFEIKATVPNDTMSIKEGQTGQAFISTKKVDKVLVLPEKLIITESNKHYVFVSSGRLAKKIEVQLGQKGEFGIEVIADLRVDDPIILEDLSEITHNIPIHIIREVANTPPPAPPPAGPTPIVITEPPTPPVNIEPASPEAKHGN